VRADEAHKGAVALLEQGIEPLIQQGQNVLLPNPFHAVRLDRDVQAQIPRDRFRRRGKQGICQILIFIPDQLAVHPHDFHQVKYAAIGQAFGNLAEQMFQVDDVMQGGMRQYEIKPLPLDCDEIEIFHPEVETQVPLLCNFLRAIKYRSVDIGAGN
jgi:hypothetical protein